MHPFGSPPLPLALFTPEQGSCRARSNSQLFSIRILMVGRRRGNKFVGAIKLSRSAFSPIARGIRTTTGDRIHHVLLSSVLRSFGLRKRRHAYKFVRTGTKTQLGPVQKKKKKEQEVQSRGMKF